MSLWVVLCIANHAVFHAQNDRLCLGSIETCYSVPKIAVLYKRGTLVPELHVSMGPSPHQWFSAFKSATLGTELHVSMGPRPHLWFYACKTAFLASELLASMGSRPHLWILDANQRLLDQNSKSLWVPSLICGFCIHNSDFWSRITSLCWSQNSPVVLCMQTTVIIIRFPCLYGSQSSSVLFGYKTAVYGTE